MNNKRETPKNRGVVDGMAETIQKTFESFDVPVEITVKQDGYRNYRFLLKVLKPVRMRVMKSFEDDLRYALGCDYVDIEAPIRGLKLVGINIPKKDKPPAPLWSDAIKSKELIKDAILAIPLGLSEMKEHCMFDITVAPHLLIAGASGSGKSGLLHSLLNSYIAKFSPDQLRFILIDTRQVELSRYNEVPHLLTSVITEERKAVLALKWLTKEMQRRFEVLEKWGMRDIHQYHEKILGKHGTSDDIELMPFIIVTIDEIADMMATYAKEVEGAIVPLAQMSRAVGIHVVIATQRPSVNVVTGLMKANIPTRIALQVASNVDSRMILDMTGAEKLSGPGDMLFVTPDSAIPPHLQSFYISDDEIESNIKIAIKKHGVFFDVQNKNLTDESFTESGIDDDAYKEAENLVITSGKASTSFLQRRLGLGYARAARVMDMLESNRIISAGQGASPRKVLMTPELREPRFHAEFQDDIGFKAAKDLVMKTGEASVISLHKQLGFSPARAVLMMDALEFFKIIGPAHGVRPRMVLLKTIKKK